MNEQNFPQSLIPRGRIDIDRFAELSDTLADAPVETFILPGGGHEALERYLTCQYGNGWTCGRFVCYKHNPELRPKDGETTCNIPSPERGQDWSNPIPERIIQRFADALEVTV